MRKTYFFIYILIWVVTSLATATRSRRNNDIAAKIGQQEDHTNGIHWSNLAVSIPQKHDGTITSPLYSLKKRKRHYLVRPSSGYVANGQICGIIGPSGAGKSTFLSALSGTIFKGSSKQVSGSVWLESPLVRDDDMKDDDHEQSIPNIRSVLSMKNGEVALLKQHDAFFSMMTTRETIDLAAFLQLSTMDRVERNKMVETILDSLGLRHVELHRVGGEHEEYGSSHLGRLSGGERRRLSVALELVSSPKVFLGDEPTTGLDSAQAQKVVYAMKKVAKERHIPVICSLHQPRATIWKSLDSFILFASGGRMIYMGDRKLAVSYFERLGYKCPAETNPAEFYIDLVTIDTEDEEQGIVDRGRIEFLAKTFEDSHEATMLSSSDTYENQENPKVSIHALQQISSSWWKEMSNAGKSNSFTQRPFHARFGVLFLRSVRQNIRDSKVNFLRLSSSVGLAVLFSQLFKTVRKGISLARSVADRTALLSFGVINMSMLAVMKTLNLFGKEKAVVIREQMRRQYSSLDYLLAKVVAELPLDMFYASVFASTLKFLTNLRIPLSLLAGTFSLMTVAGASIGFAVGSLTSNVEEAMTVGMPMMVILMAVGIINPSGVDPTTKVPRAVALLKIFSPIKMAIEALCIAEYSGMVFGDKRSWNIKELPKMGGLALVQNGDQVLDALGLGSKKFDKAVKELSLLSAFNLLVSWVGLKLSSPIAVDMNKDPDIKITSSLASANKTTGDLSLLDNNQKMAKTKSDGRVIQIPATPIVKNYKL